MKLDWERAGVVRATLKVQELAALVAGARMAAAALAAQSPDQAADLERALSSFDRALTGLRPRSASDSAPASASSAPATAPTT